MGIIEKYLTKIIHSDLTHNEIIVIAMSIESAIEGEKGMTGIKFFIPTLKAYGINITKRKVIARFMLDELRENERIKETNLFDYTQNTEDF